MSSKPKLIIGRVETSKAGEVDLVPLRAIDPHREDALRHQRKLAALIAAAYLYRDQPSARSLRYLKEAALAL